MTTISSPKLAALAIAAAASLALGACADSKPSDEDVGSVQQNWWIYGGFDHGSNSGESLWFLKPELRRALGAATEDVDSDQYQHEEIDTVDHSYFHFDNCRFEEATDRIQHHFDEIVATLDDDTLPYSETNKDWAVARRNLGFIFHAVQDFYAHSNWVESGQRGLVDRNRYEWTPLKARTLVGEGKGMMVIEDDLQVATDGLPQGVTATLDKMQHKLALSDAFGNPLRNDEGVVVQGLITGTHHNKDNFGQGACLRKSGLSMAHGDMALCYDEDVQPVCQLKGLLCERPDPKKYRKILFSLSLKSAAKKLALHELRYGLQELNFMRTCGEMWRSTYLAKDHPPDLIPVFPAPHPKEDDEQRTIWRDQANQLAREQTVHEFCRLGNLMERRYGPKGRDRLFDAFVENREAALDACGVQRFAEKTNDWKLAGVRGTRLSVADIDGDDFPDLVVREANDRPTSWDSNATRRVWLLRNQRNGTFSDWTRDSRILTGPVRGAKDPVSTGRSSQVVTFADIDNDGDMDAFSGSPSYTPKNLSGRVRPEIMLNDGKGVFSTLAQYPFGNVDLNPGGATFLDYDRDGLVDLFVPARKQRTGGPNGWLLRNTGKPQALFEPASATFAGAGMFAQSSLACDLNNDGRQELLVGTLSREANGLWEATGQDAFSARHTQSRYAYDVDEGDKPWKDNLRARAFCSYLRQRGEVARGQFSSRADCESLPGECGSCVSFPCDAFRAPQSGETVESCSGVADYPADAGVLQFGFALRWNHVRDRKPGRLGGDTFATVCADFDRDGRLDLFNAEQRVSSEGRTSDASQVLKNISTDRVDFLRPGTAATGLALPHGAPTWTEGVQSAASFDFDNDGLVDLLLGGADAVGESGRLFKNDGGTTGREVHFTSLYVAGLTRAQGFAVADFDRDGDLDFVAGSSSFHCDASETCAAEQVRFFENQLSDKKSWVQLKLTGIAPSTGASSGKANRVGIGARVTVTYQSQACEGGTCTLVQEVDGGHGHFGTQNEQALHFGLGTVDEDKVHVTVRWPRRDGEKNEQKFNVPPGHRYELKEDFAFAIEVPDP